MIENVVKYVKLLKEHFHIKNHSHKKDNLLSKLISVCANELLFETDTSSFDKKVTHEKLITQYTLFSW